MPASKMSTGGILSIVEVVAHDAIVSESGKQPANCCRGNNHPLVNCSLLCGWLLRSAGS
ncbi:unnamed protein product [Rhodiola kirilowii]